MGKALASRGSKAETKKEAERIAEEGFASMEQFFHKNRGVLLDLLKMTQKLRQLPKLEAQLPTIALVGAPNVGKSSLVQSISSGRPEICNYPFTTRSIKLGHFYVNGKRHQVTDTPGLLNRPEDEKNVMEMLTLATLRHLPTAVIFVLDATEECGTSLEDQLTIRGDLRSLFPQKPWLDVFSKSDLLKEAIEAADREFEGEASKQVAALKSLTAAIRISCRTEEGLDPFKSAIIEMLTEF